MPKIKETENRIIVHVGDIWNTYDISKLKFRTHDVGKPSNTLRIGCKVPHGKWHTYAWSFLKTQVSKSARTLICKDKNAYDILNKMKEGGDLKGYRLDIVVPIQKQYQYYKSSLIKKVRR